MIKSSNEPFYEWYNMSNDQQVKWTIHINKERIASSINFFCKQDQLYWLFSINNKFNQIIIVFK